LTVRAHLRDKDGNDAKSGTVTFTIPAGVWVGTTAGPATVTAPVSNGYASIAVKSDQATDSANEPPAYHLVTATFPVGATPVNTAITNVRDADESPSPLVRQNGEVWLEFDPEPDPDPDKESWLIHPNATGVANGTSRLTVVAHIRDSKGNNIADGTIVTFGVPSGTLATPAGLNSPEIADGGTLQVATLGGLAAIDVRSEDATGDNVPAYYCVTANVQVNGQAAEIKLVKTVDSETAANLRTDGEVRLEFDPDAEVPGMSWLIEPAGSAEANGVDTVTVKAHVQDGKKNNVKDGTKVTFHIPQGTSSGSYVAGVGGVDVPTTTVGGYASIDVKSSVANNTAANPNLYYVVTAYLGDSSALGAIQTVKTEATDSPTGVALRTDGEAHVVFGSGPGGATNSWLVQPDNAEAVADGSDAQSLVVKAHVKDGAGNDAGSGTIVFHIPSGVSVGEQAGPADIEVPVSAGWAQIAVKSRKADGSPYSVTASVKGDAQIVTVKNQAETYVLPDRSDVRLTFKAGPVDATKTAMSLWVDPWEARADGVTPVPAYMTIQDKDGNAIAGATGCSFELIYPADQAGPLFGNANTGAKTTTVTAPTGADGRCNVQIYSYQEGSTPVKGTFTSGGVTAESPGPDSDRPKANFSNVNSDAKMSEFAVQRTSTNRSPDKAIADGLDSYTVTVTVRDSAGNLLNNKLVDIYYTLDSQGATPQLVQARSGADGNSPGVATAQITSEDIGIYRVEAKFGNDSIATQPQGTVYTVPVEFVADSADPGKSTVTYSSGTALPDGKGAHWAEVQLLDPKDNPVSNTTVYFTLDTPTQGYFALEDGTNLSQGVRTLITNELGKVKVWVRKADAANGTVILNTWIGSAGGTRLDAAHTFDFEAGGPSPEESTLEITPDPSTPTPKVADGVQFYNAVVTVRDESQIALSGRDVTFDFDKAGVVITPTGPYKTNASGQVTVKLTSEKAGVYKVNANVGGGYAQPVDQTIEFVHGPGVEGQSSLTTTGGPRIANGTSQHEATVEVRDEKGNAVEGQDVYLTVEAGNTDIVGPTLSATSGKTNANGLFKVVVTSEEPGTFAVRAYLGTSAQAAREVKTGSPANVQFSAGKVDPSKSSRTITPDTDSSSQVSVTSDGENAYRVQVKVISIDNIPVDLANVRLVLDSAAAGYVTVVPQNSDDPQTTGTSTSGYYGTYYWDLKSQTEGTYYASVEVWAVTEDENGVEVGEFVKVGQTVTLRYKGGPLDGSQSWLIQPDKSSVADGTSLLQVQVHAKDKDGNNATTGTVKFSVPTGLTAVVSGVETVGGPGRTASAAVVDGYATVAYKTETPNQVGVPYVVTATTGDDAAITAVKNALETGADGPQNGQVELDFTPDDASPSNSVLSIPTTLTGGDPVGTRVAGRTDSDGRHVARVAVLDRFGNPVRDSSTTVVFSYLYTDLAGQDHTGSWPAVSVMNGVAEQPFTSLVATEWTISATIADVEVQGSPQKARFVSDEVNWDRTLGSFEVDSGIKLANGLAPAYARVKVQDANGNPVQGETLTLSLLWTAYPDGNGGPLFNNGVTGSKSVSVTSDQDGWASANIYSVWERLNVDVRAEYGQKVSAVKQVNFQNDAADPNVSRFRVEPLGTYVDNVAVADGEEGYRVYVTLKNSDGVLLNGVSATVTATPIGIAGATEVRTTVTSGVGNHGQGVGAFDLKTTYAGEWKVTVAIGADVVPREDDPALAPAEWLVVFKHDDPVPGSSRLVGPSQSAQANGVQTQVVRAVIADGNGNAVPGWDVLFKVPENVKVRAGDGTLTDGPVNLMVRTSDGSDGGVKGTAVLTLVSLKTGVLYVGAEVGGGEITDGGPARVEFTNADLSLVNAELVVTTMPSTTTVAGDDYHTPQVTLRDESGNVFTPVRTVAFAYRLQGTTDWVAGATVSTVAGVATTSFTRSTAGVYEVAATVTSGPDQGRVPDDQTVALATFVAGSADAGKSTFGVTEGSVLADDSTPHTAKVTVLDKNENPVQGESVTFKLTGGAEAHFSTLGCDLRTCTRTSSELGVVEVSIVSPKELFDVTVSAYLSGDRLIGSGVVVFENDPPVAEKSTWSITPDGPIVADGAKQYKVEVQVRDGNGLPKANATIGLEWTPTGITPDRAGPYVSDASGTVVVFLTSTKAGEYTVNAMIGSDKIAPADRKIVFESDDIDPGSTFLTSPQASAIANGEAEQVVKATVRDQNGNAVKDAVVSFDVPAGTQLAPDYSAVVQVNEEGVAELHLVSKAADTYQVTASAKRPSDVASTKITVGSPAEVNFVHGPVSLEHSVISGTPTGPLPASGLTTDAYTVQVALRDQYNNPVLVSGTPVGIIFRLYTPDGTTPVNGVEAVTRNVATNASGVASTEFYTTRAGVWMATGGPASGIAQDGSPVALEFEPTARKATSSVFDVTTNTVLANGQLHHEAWVIVKDQNGNLVDGEEVVFEVEQGTDVPGPTLSPANGRVTSCDFYAEDPSTRPSWCLTAADHGKALVEIRSNEPGSFEVSAKIGGETVTGSPKEVSFTSGPPDPSRTSYTVTPDASVEANWPEALGDPGDKYTVTVTVKSAAEILVPNARVRLSGLDPAVRIVQQSPVPGTTIGYTGDPASGAYGSYSWDLYTSKAGTYSAAVQVDTGTDQWVTIAPATFTVTYKAGPPTAEESWLIQPSASATANGTAALTVSAKVLDEAGNNATTGKVVFHVPAGVSVLSGSNQGVGPRDTQVDVVNGSADIRVVSSTANTVANPYYSITAGVLADGQTTEVLMTEVKDTDGNVLAEQSDVRLVFTSGGKSAVDSELTIPTANDVKYVGGVDKHTAQVVVLDENQNAVAGVLVQLQWIVGTVEGPGAGTWTTVADLTSNNNGIVTWDFAAPNNEAVWVWVRASLVTVAPNGARTLEPVGPVGERTVVGAEFSPRVIDSSPTEASFATEPNKIRNNGTSQSWARVVAQDQYGNGIGGLSVTFTLPSAPPAGLLGVPVFANGSNTITVTTCARNIPAASVPAECKIDGVYTPGLAWVPVVSHYEGDFEISGSVATDSGAIAVGPGLVKFESPEGDAAESSFTVVKTPGAAPVGVANAVVADGVASYTVTVTVMGDAGGTLKPASGECVVPDLPANVTTVPASDSADCVGGYVTGVNGQATFQIVTQTPGLVRVGAKLAGDSIPTVANGATFYREVLFVGGPPSVTHSELISPEAPVRADDPAGATVSVVLRDAYGNLAACWNTDGTQKQCEVLFSMPVHVWVGSDPDHGAVPSTYRAFTQLIDFSAPTTLVADIAAKVALFGDEGTFPITAKLEGADVVIADGVVSTSGPAKAYVTFLDSIPPSEPVVNPSDGNHVDGSVAEEDLEDAAAGDLTVVIEDGDGGVRSCLVNTDGTFDCPIVPGLPDGTDLTVTIVDDEGNRSDPVEIVTDGVAPGEPVVNPSDGNHVDGSVAEEDLGDAATGDLVVIIRDDEGTVINSCPVREDGTFDCPIVPGVPDGTDLVVTIEDPAHNANWPPVEITTDGVPPGVPVVDESDGTHVTGVVPDADREDAADGNLDVVVTDEDGNVIARCDVESDGSFDCPISSTVPDGETIRIELVDQAGNESAPVDRIVDGVPPGDPTIDESNGSRVTGEVADADLGDAASGDLKVVVRDEDGNVLASCPVNPDGSFDCPVVPKLPHGEEATVEVVDAAGNHSDSTIVVDGVAPGTPVIEPSRGDEVTGVVPDEDLSDAAAGKLVVVVTDPATGDELCRTGVDPDGTWVCVFEPAIPDGTLVEVTLVDAAGNLSDTGTMTVDATAPVSPVADPTAGETLTGRGEEEGNKVTVQDAEGNVLCTATVGADRTWSCQLEPAAAEGDMLTITETDLSRNQAVLPWRVGVPEIAVAKKALCRGDRQAATGLNFQPGETVTAVTSGDVAVGSAKANSDGMVVFQWVISETTPRNTHTLTLRGPLSGAYTASYDVNCPGLPADKPVVLGTTGPSGMVGVAGAALGLALAGWLLLLAAKRRRRTEQGATA
jgi:hypothetical protein